MKRSGFTMVELIFVIVILGILASVAIPKLAATRDDAKISKAASEVSTLVSDLGAYYTGHGVFDSNVSQMTNVKLTDTDANITNGATYVDPANTGQVCLNIQTSQTDGNLTITNGASTTTFCKGVQKTVSDLVKVHQFGGSSIEFN